MKNCFIFISLFVISTVNCMKCPQIPLNETNMQCFCSPKEAKGWEKSCFIKPSKDDHKLLKLDLFYSLGYNHHKSVLELNCGYNEDINYTKELFKDVNETTATGFKFIHCPLPVIPVMEMLGFFQVIKLKFSSEDINSTVALNSSFLNGLSDLKEVYFSGGIFSISKDVFVSSNKLTLIKIEKCNITTLPKELFKSTKNLVLLSLSKNNLSSLPETLFNELSKLKLLYLYKNKMTVLPAKLFRGMKLLKILELSSNSLVELPSEIFSDLSSLEQLSLSGNNLISLQSGIFENNMNLKVLNMNANQFVTLPSDLLSGLNNLKQILMRDCNMSNIPDDFFSHAKFLEYINIRNNRMKSISPFFFSQNVRLSRINMVKNDVQNLTYDMLKGLFKLKLLVLSENKIKYISADAFQDVYQLEELSLTHNKISELDRKVFQELTKVRKMDLSHNQLDFKSNSEHFMNLINLEALNLSYNNLTEVPSLHTLVSLKIVDLRHNKITVLSPMTDVSKRAKYLFGYNALTKIDMFYIKSALTIEKLSSPRSNTDNLFTDQPMYDLGTNSIDCDCKIYDFIVYLRKYINREKIPVRFATSKLICNSPLPMYNKSIAKIDAQQLQCKVIKKCPEHCSCNYNSFLNTKEVKCGFGLKSIPNDLPNGTSIFETRNASLTDRNLSGLSNKIFENISNLVLSHNNISTFLNDYLPLKLKLLDLSFNKFEVMPEWLPSYTQNHKTRYYLRNNSWVCNCSTIAFKGWLIKNHQNVLDMKSIACSSNKSANGTIGRLIYQVKDSIMCPSDNFDESGISTYNIVIAVAILSIFTILICIFVCFYKQHQIKFFFFRHNIFMFIFKDDDNIEEKKFDAFISYSFHDSDFVINELVPELENRDPKYTLCIHERNFIPGTAISENIINATALSRRTIVILSNNFLQSDWGILEFKCAHQKMLEDNCNQIIIVVLDEIDENMLSQAHKDLQLCLSTKTYLKRSEVHFWEKLRHALPKQPLQIQNVDKNEPLLVLPDFELQQKLKSKVKEINNEINEKMKLKLSEVELNNFNNSCYDNYSHDSEVILNPVFKNNLKPKSIDSKNKINV